MGWFGSLQLAYKYAIVFGSLLIATLTAGVIKVYLNRRKLRKHTRAADLEAAGKKGEQLEPNQRKLDEGDLFGIRATESGYFGGVAQSRPTSAAGLHSPSGSFSRTSMASRPLPTELSTSPSGSTVNLAMGSRRCSSPLAKHVVSRADHDREPSHSKRTKSAHVGSKLRPSSPGHSGRIKRDPAVHMSWNVPQSPTNDTSPVSDSSSEKSGFRSFSIPNQTPQTAKLRHIATSTPRITLIEGTTASVQHVPTPRARTPDVKLQSSQTTSPDFVGAGSASVRSREPPPTTVVSDPPQVPPRAATAIRPIHPVKPESSFQDGENPFMLIEARYSSVLPPTVPRPVSTVGKWGADVFRELEAAVNKQQQGPEVR